MKRALLAAVALLVAFGIIGGVVHRLLPEPAPPISAYPSAGDRVENKYSGERFTVLRSGRETNGAFVLFDGYFQPGGSVPIDHVHPSQAETFIALDGSMSIWVNGEVHVLDPGEQFTVPAGAPHRAFNSSDTTPAHGQVEFRPAGSADLLAIQFHGFLADGPRKGLIEQLLQMSLMAPRYEIYPATHPRWVQSVAFFLVAPTARLLGYKSFYPEYSEQARRVAERSERSG